MILFKKTFGDMGPLDVDFKKPWWTLIAQQRWLFLTIVVCMLITNTFWALTPFIIEKLLEHATLFAIGSVFCAWIAVDYLNFYIRWLNGRFQLQCIHGIYQSAHSYLLTIDPVYHVRRSSGAVLAKIERGARGYEQLLDEITFEFVPLCASATVMVVALLRCSFIAALLIMGLLITIFLCSYYFVGYASRQREKKFIKTDDQFKATAVENLAQVQLVRATFASDYINQKLGQKIEKNMLNERSLWLFYASVGFILNLLYVVSIFILLLVLTWQIKSGATTYASALSLAIAYIQSTRSITRITSPLRRYMRSNTAVNDLFSFMSSFGARGFPVLSLTHPHKPPMHKDMIHIEVEGITFHYETAFLFENHSLKIICSKEDSNKLFGIIGASGTGKTTLLSMLGGQLKPHKGSIIINGIDIYTVNDAARKELIALQGQIATSVAGTIKYNLLFGLPQDHGFTDQDLLDILQKTGLLAILESHNGLETMLGEGGLSLSGGQRQRLNFAGLYIRALYYQPILILIDEPTSNLDEVSEAAITAMIVELSQKAVTLVIAHRLKTIAQARGLIDMSLLKQENIIKIYEPTQLQHSSEYYQRLVKGTVPLE